MGQVLTITPTLTMEGSTPMSPSVLPPNVATDSREDIPATIAAHKQSLVYGIDEPDEDITLNPGAEAMNDESEEDDDDDDDVASALGDPSASNGAGGDNEQDDDGSTKLGTLTTGGSVGMDGIKPKKAVISMLNSKQFMLICDTGRGTPTSDMYRMSIEKLQLPDCAKGMFALWMVSPSLQIQLKDHHMPFKVLKRWSELLRTFAYVNPYSELPLMYFKRDEMFHQGLERRVSDSKCIRLLFEEMTFYMIYSFYPCSVDEAANLAAIHLKLFMKQKQVGLIPVPPTKENVADCTGCNLPPHLVKQISHRKWRKAILEKFSCLEDNGVDDNTTWRQRYLAIGRRWSFYGSTFFYGHIEPEEVKYTFRERPDILVRVGVNLDGVHVIKDKENEVLLSLTYEELQYNSYDTDSGATEPSFLIEYTADVDDDTIAEANTKSQMVIWTPQSGMIDALVSKHIDALASYEEHLKARKMERTASYRPNAKGALGRKGGADAVSAKYFSLSRLRTWKSKKSSSDSGSDVASSLGSARSTNESLPEVTSPTLAAEL